MKASCAICTAALVTTLAAAFQPAAAATLSVTDLQYGVSHADTVHISYSGNAGPNLSNLWVYSGGFQTTHTTANTSFISWCVDIFKALQLGQQVSDYRLVPAASIDYIGMGKATELGRLATEALPKVTSSVTASAFQLAAWEILFDAPGNHSLATGSFTAKDSLYSASIPTAQNWLDNLPASSLYTVNVWQSPTTQNLAVFALSPVTEPDRYVMLLSGLGLMVFVARRRRG